MLAAVHRKVLAIDARFQRSVHRLQEIVAMRLDMEADEVGAEHAVQHLALPGADGERLGIGPGNVPELGDDQVGIIVALEHARQQAKVVILDEDERRCVIELGLKRAIEPGALFLL